MKTNTVQYPYLNSLWLIPLLCRKPYNSFRVSNAGRLIASAINTIQEMKIMHLFIQLFLGIYLIQPAHTAGLQGDQGDNPVPTAFEDGQRRFDTSRVTPDQREKNTEELSLFKDRVQNDPAFRAKLLQEMRDRNDRFYSFPAVQIEPTFHDWYLQPADGMEDKDPLSCLAYFIETSDSDPYLEDDREVSIEVLQCAAQIAINKLEVDAQSRGPILNIVCLERTIRGSNAFKNYTEGSEDAEEEQDNKKFLVIRYSFTNQQRNIAMPSGRRRIDTPQLQKTYLDV